MQALKYAIVTCAAVVTTFVIRQFAYWDIGQFLGYDMIMTLHHVRPVQGSYDVPWHDTLVSIMGPAVTVAQASLVFALIKRNHSKNLYPLLPACFSVEWLAGVLNLTRLSGMRAVSLVPGFLLLTLPVILLMVHAFFVYKTTLREHYEDKFILPVYFYAVLFSSAWVLFHCHLSH
jgi:hypothetical protein